MLCYAMFCCALPHHVVLLNFAVKVGPDMLCYEVCSPCCAQSAKGKIQQESYHNEQSSQERNDMQAGAFFQELDNMLRTIKMVHQLL